MTLWWGLLWRTAILFAVVAPMAGWVAADFLVGRFDDANVIFFKPTISSLLIANALWLAAAWPDFLTRLLWGERLRLTPAQWVAVGRGIALLCVAFGVLNIAIWRLASTDGWVQFNVWGPLPLLALSLAALAVQVTRMRD